jgi:Skp family chaperone for outer membrane proteins
MNPAFRLRGAIPSKKNTDMSTQIENSELVLSTVQSTQVSGAVAYNKAGEEIGHDYALSGRSFAEIKTALRALNPTLSARKLGQLAREQMASESSIAVSILRVGALMAMRHAQTGEIANIAQDRAKRTAVVWEKPAKETPAKASKAEKEAEKLRAENEDLKARLAALDAANLAKATTNAEKMEAEIAQLKNVTKAFREGRVDEQTLENTLADLRDESHILDTVLGALKGL